LNDEVVIIDLVYGSSPTRLVDNSLAREQVVIEGRDVLLTQVVRQFRMMTGNEMPTGTMADLLGRRTAISDLAPSDADGRATPTIPGTDELEPRCTSEPRGF